MPEQSDLDIAQQIRLALEIKGWSQRKLADKAMLGEATIFRLMKGDFSRKTLLKIEKLLSLDLTHTQQSPAPANNGVVVASVQNGGYLRELYDYYQGDYICVRPVFINDSHYMAYQMRIEWSDAESSLVFFDKNPRHEQKGVITVPIGTQYLHFLTQDKGSVRLITAYHMPSNRNSLRGLSLTFANPKGHDFYPAAVPIVMRRIPDDMPQWRKLHGMIEKSDPLMSVFKTELEDIALNPMMLHP